MESGTKIGPAFLTRRTVMSGEAILAVLLVGLIAGWLAGQIVRGGGFGLVGDILVGVAGALIASWLLPHFHVDLGVGLVAVITSATIGAVVLLLLMRVIRQV